MGLYTIGVGVFMSMGMCLYYLWVVVFFGGGDCLVGGVGFGDFLGFCPPFILGRKISLFVVFSTGAKWKIL